MYLQDMAVIKKKKKQTNFDSRNLNIFKKYQKKLYKSINSQFRLIYKYNKRYCCICE